MDTMTSLGDLTKQESGIVIYGDEGIVCNWAGIEGLPHMFAAGLIGLGEEIPCAKGEHIDDLSSALVGVTLYNYADNPIELPQSGTVYRLPNGVTVIAPDDWA